MSLSAPVERTSVHARRYDFSGYRRADGLWDIEGRLVDTKSYGFSTRERGDIRPGEPVHEMVARLTIGDDFVVRAVEVSTLAGPFYECPAVAANYHRLVGERLGTGWRKALRQRLGGIAGCTHITEMLGAMATVAFQTIYPILAKEGKLKPAADRRPALIDSCHAFRSDGPVVEREWPRHYTGPNAK